MKAIIIGRARGVWAEILEAKKLCTFDKTIVVNQAGIDYPEHIDHWVSFHASLLFTEPVTRGGWNRGLGDWVKKRRAKGYPDAQNYWTSTTTAYRLNNAPIRTVICEGGSSGLIGVFVALHERATKVVLAGIPMSAEYGHYDQEGDWKEAEHYRKQWLKVLPTLQGKVKSMSGWTQELLGAPTREWLDAPGS